VESPSYVDLFNNILDLPVQNGLTLRDVIEDDVKNLFVVNQTSIEAGKIPIPALNLTIAVRGYCRGHDPWHHRGCVDADGHHLWRQYLVEGVIAYCLRDIPFLVIDEVTQRLVT
jgi:hypothetical protein